jgi:hypothetical protein
VHTSCYKLYVQIQVPSLVPNLRSTQVATNSFEIQVPTRSGSKPKVHRSCYKQLWDPSTNQVWFQIWGPHKLLQTLCPNPGSKPSSKPKVHTSCYKLYVQIQVPSLVPNLRNTQVATNNFEIQVPTRSGSKPKEHTSCYKRYVQSTRVWSSGAHGSKTPDYLNPLHVSLPPM